MVERLVNEVRHTMAVMTVMAVIAMYCFISLFIFKYFEEK